MEGSVSKSSIPIDKWALDPLFSAYSPLFILSLRRDITIINREEKYELYLFQRPVRRVCLHGVVVERYIRTQRSNAEKVVFKVDDSTGEVECWKYLNKNDVGHNAVRDITIGDCVTIKGVLNVYNGELIVQASIIEKTFDPNIESLHMLTVLRMYKYEYKNPPLIGSTVHTTESHNGSSEEALLCAIPSPPHCHCCTADSLLPRNISPLLQVRRALLYCPCVAVYDHYDSTAILRITLLSYMLRIHAAMPNKQPATPENRSRKPLREKYMMVDDIIRDPALRRVVADAWNASSRHAYGYLHSTHPEAVNRVCGTFDGYLGKSIKKRRTTDGGTSESVDVPKHEDCDFDALLTHLLLVLCSEGILEKKSSDTSVSNESGNFAVQMITVFDTIIPYLRYWIKEYNGECSSNSIDMEKIWPYITRCFRSVFTRIPQWKWKHCLNYCIQDTGNTERK